MDTDRPRRSFAAGTDRAQSVFDYSIGVSLFLIVIIGVLVFVPTAFGSLNDEAGISSSERDAADRAADHLAEDGFGDADTPNRFSYVCLIAYFDGGTACGFQADRSPAADASLGPARSLNVTVEADLDSDGEREIICWNGDAQESKDPTDTIWVTPAHPDCGVSFSTETSAAANVEYASATRVGTLRTLELGSSGTDRTMVYVTVRVW